MATRDQKFRRCLVAKINADVGSGLTTLASFCNRPVAETRTTLRKLVNKGTLKVRRGGMYDNRQPWFYPPHLTPRRR